MLQASAHPTITALLRIGGAVVGGYLLAAAGAALCAVALHDWLDWPRSEAVLFAAMVAFVFYLLLLLWAFSAPSVMRMLVIMTVGILAMRGLLQTFAS